MARGGRDDFVRRHLRLHGDVGAAVEHWPRRCRGGDRRHECDLLGAARCRVRRRRRIAQVRGRCAAAAVRRRRPCCARRSGCVRNAPDSARDRPAANIGGVGDAEDARRAPLRPLPVLPRRRLSSRAARNGTGRDAGRRDGGSVGSRRDPRQPRDRRAARAAGARRRQRPWQASAGGPGRLWRADADARCGQHADRGGGAGAAARAATRGRTTRGRAPACGRRVRPVRGNRRNRRDGGRRGGGGSARGR